MLIFAICAWDDVLCPTSFERLGQACAFDIQRWDSLCKPYLVALTDPSYYRLSTVVFACLLIVYSNILQSDRYSCARVLLLTHTCLILMSVPVPDSFDWSIPLFYYYTRRPVGHKLRKAVYSILVSRQRF
jgi:hypothetical protein